MVYIVSNKGMNGVNQKGAPGLSATINMKLKRKHSGVKMNSMLDCCSYPAMNTPYCIKYSNETGGCG